MLNNIKIIFLDLDGTLLNKKGEFSEYTEEIIKKVVNKNIYVILASGRATSDMIEKSKSVNSSPIVISGNGTMIFDYQKNLKIYQNKMNLDEVKKIWDFAKKNNINITLNSLYRRLKSKNSKKDGIIINNLNEVEDEITQLVLDSKDLKSIEFAKQFIEQNTNLEVKNFSGKAFEFYKELMYEFDVTNKGNSKGMAVKKLLNFLNISKSESLCIGDQINDFSMFEECGVKIAMKNANQNLKKVADFITDYDNNDDGAANFIEKNVI